MWDKKPVEHKGDHGYTGKLTGMIWYGYTLAKIELLELQFIKKQKTMACMFLDMLT